MAQGIPVGLTPESGRRFGLQVGIAFAALGAFSAWRGHPLPAVILASLGLGLVLGGVLAPSSMGPIYRGWMGLALAISKVTTPIFMGLIYFLVLVPTGLLLRAFGHYPLRRSSASATYWLRRPEGPEGRGDMQRQF
jgi:hypothetical protein